MIVSFHTALDVVHEPDPRSFAIDRRVHLAGSQKLGHIMDDRLASVHVATEDEIVVETAGTGIREEIFGIVRLPVEEDFRTIDVAVTHLPRIRVEVQQKSCGIVEDVLSFLGDATFENIHPHLLETDRLDDANVVLLPGAEGAIAVRLHEVVASAGICHMHQEAHGCGLFVVLVGLARQLLGLGQGVRSEDLVNVLVASKWIAHDATVYLPAYGCQGKNRPPRICTLTNGFGIRHATVTPGTYSGSSRSRTCLRGQMEALTRPSESMLPNSVVNEQW